MKHASSGSELATRAFYTALGLAAGSLNEIQTTRPLILGGSIALAAVTGTYIGIKYLRAGRLKSEQAELFTKFRDPDVEALTFAKQKGWNEGSVVGKVIEVWYHPALETMTDLPEVGVPPSEVVFCQPQPSNFADVVKACGGPRDFGKPNRKKFGIHEFPLFTSDDENYTFKFSSTDWNTYRTVVDSIKGNPALRWAYSDVNPLKNRLPQALSLQYLVALSDGSVLAMRRKDELPVEGGRWSFSGEEGINEEDFKSTAVSVAECLFRRAFMEEVFGHRGNDAVEMNRVWVENCSHFVHSYRIWSVFLEENTGIFQLFGVIQLNITAEELKDKRVESYSKGWGTDDNEGVWYKVTPTCLADLLLDGICTATRIHGAPEETNITKESLHATSRYRLWRWYAATHRDGMPLMSLRLPSN